MSTRTTTTHACPTTTTPTTLTPTPSTNNILHTHLAATTTTTAGMSNLSTSNVNDNRPTTTITNTRQHTTLLNTMYTQAESISWRLRQYCIEAITTANSRQRRRRRRDDINNNNCSTNNYSNSNYATHCSSSNCIQSNNNNNNNYNNNNNSNSFAYSTASHAAQTDAVYHDHNNNNNNNNSYMSNNNNNNNNSANSSSSNSNISNLSKTVTTTLSSPAIQLYNVIAQSLSSSSTAITYITALLILTTLCSCCAASPCDRQSWWDPLKDKCIPCTVCQGELIPLRPCQMDRDTICGTIYDLKIDWVVLAKTEPNWKERRKDDDNFELDQQLSHEELQQLQDGTLPMDWQTTALFMAVLACLIFFIIAAGILVHHMRQWRRMERRLDQDVEELSTKLMAKLAEVQSMEGGTFFIGNADALGVSTNFQPQHVLLPEKPAKHHHERRILKTLQPGNVYIEENGSKG